MNLAISPLSFETTVGSYRVHHVIAEGDVATVREAAHLVLPRRAAIKVLRPEVVASPQAGQRLLREACVLEAFTHPGVVRVYDCGILEDGRPWLAMELVGGTPLSALFGRLGRLPIEQVRSLTMGLVEVLAAAHRSGVVHRALAPSHILLGGGGCHDVRVLGWGLARQPGGAHDLVGDRRADVYAIGAMAYQAATGAPPYVAVPPVARVISQFHARPTPVRTLRPELAPELARLIEAMIDGDPASRPTAVDVAVELARLEGPYDDFQVFAEGTSPGRDPKTAAEQDWEQLVALGSPRPVLVDQPVAALNLNPHDRQPDVKTIEAAAPAAVTAPPPQALPAPDPSESPAPSWTRIFTFASFGLALVALAVTIWSVGPRTLLAQLVAIGWGFAAVLVIEVAVTLCDSAALSGFLGAGGRRPSFFQVLKAQVAGRAVNAVTPLASLGEATKATTLMERTSSRRAIGAVFHYNLASAGVTLLTIAIGAPICALVLDLPDALAVALYAGAAVAAAGLVVGVLLVRRGMLVSLVDAGRAIRVLSKARTEKWRKFVLEIDRIPYRDKHQRSQFAPAKWIVVSRVLGLASMWVVLASVGYLAGPGTVAAVATAGQLISMIASVVPMGLGISEGSNAALFVALGAPASLGVTMVLGSRIKLIAYAVLGLAIISASTAVVTGARHVRARTHGGVRRPLTATSP